MYLFMPMSQRATQEQKGYLHVHSSPVCWRCPTVRHGYPRGGDLMWAFYLCYVLELLDQIIKGCEIGRGQRKGQTSEAVDSERRSGTARAGGRSVKMFRVGWGFSLATIPWSGRGSLGGSRCGLSITNWKEKGTSWEWARQTWKVLSQSVQDCH